MRRLAPVLVLFFLAPLIPELLTGSTPLRLYFTPFSFLVNTGLYSVGAVLIRELARRRGLGWSRILLLGAAYGIVEEGLVIQSFFNPYHPGLGTLSVYGRAFGVSWVWVEGLILFHAVFSITIPILLTELLFPARRADPWLGKRGLRVFTSIFAFVIVAGALLFTVILHQQHKDYLPPLLPYLAAIAAVALLARLALRPPKAKTSAGVAVFVPQTRREPPRLWQLRLLGFGAVLSYYLIIGLLTNKGSRVPAPVPMLIEALLAYSLYSLVRRWSGPRWSWDDRHRLALATGGMLFFALADILLSPFLLKLPEQLLVGLLAIVLLTLLARRIAARARQTAAAATLPTEYLSPRRPVGSSPAYAAANQPTVFFPDASVQPPPTYPPDAPTINLH